ncbi:putative heme d1 biosynthesis radical SAM protein NirJ1 [Tepidibacillus infernus]|uniref:Mycofactocin maturase MftC n=1 Tax=Tepidibacillus decaturensis TaxID=1413211 RepID=A0A135L440_9BACI|nr:MULTISPECIES: putative heme d1 biosynthesis radical SAM protein NirJ1 [Tepidibacillus]KXG43784.1 radical SAM protein [Tepidibacillus decaturensis]GBF11997.1 antilisterial bacteriocin subtilosin biosynthesis protein AlbA [Tepidibacillus sp. HK-1]
MIGITKLLTNSSNFGDQLRYSKGAHGRVNGTHLNHGPVVVWNVTRTCNLHCIHCYSSSESIKYENELSTEEAKQMIDQLADFQVPVLLLSGGEPLIREDILELAEYAINKGIRVTFSTNGTLIDQEMANTIKEIGVGYVGVSFDGINEKHDEFRRSKGAFEKALNGVRHLIEVGQRVGLRFTINKHNYLQLNDIFDFMEKENINRACFYHLGYSGRGSEMMKEDLTHEETRDALNIIIERTLDFHHRGLEKEILTVDNHADGPYLYLKMKEKNPEQAAFILEMLQRNGGNRSGIAIANIDHRGNVHADQFTQNHTFGNIREQHFGDIWSKAEHPILNGLKNRKPLLEGRCASCQWLQICNGNFRSRAEAATGNFWASDPACYLTDEEIGIV